MRISEKHINIALIVAAAIMALLCAASILEAAGTDSDMPTERPADGARTSVGLTGGNDGSQQ